MLEKIWQWRYKIYALVFCICVLVTAPASLLTLLLKDTLPKLWLSEAKGSFWQGEVDQAIIKVNGGSLSLGKVQWSLKPSSLLLLSPTIELKTLAPGQSLIATASAYPNGKLQLANLRGEFPLSILEPWVPLLMSGQVFFDIAKLTLKDNAVTQLQGRINLRDTVWRGGDVPMPLGHYQADISSDDKAISVLLSDQKAQLGLQGSINAMLAGQYQMALSLSATQGLNPAVIKSVAWLGKKQGDSVVVIKRSGQWR
ncbi:type II secretion system protein N [Dasania sp. GY-MA-18]|uniref:Type II secretion system protein N n=1 Tax=Dasania phycosphaerae TaxID=2950436 RepID=A0A9J6RLT7_9GAMM|nr:MULTISPECIES: type II secretion system protein N [Dasania]MCR8923246.1 type II secretion system protein N [Dasania sp. GY-MA-18]MCZ0865678.1 type II secretion system protein N [Dasania phycosphaerae]MCZ0869403.1 type II secretion system protein N [Dasania phycosphaerae]